MQRKYLEVSHSALPTPPKQMLQHQACSVFSHLLPQESSHIIYAQGTLSCRGIPRKKRVRSVFLQKLTAPSAGREFYKFLLQRAARSGRPGFHAGWLSTRLRQEGDGCCAEILSKTWHVPYALPPGAHGGHVHAGMTRARPAGTSQLQVCPGRLQALQAP